MIKLQARSIDLIKANFLNSRPSGRAYRFTHAGIFLAFSFPGFFLSTRRGSRVTQPAIYCRQHHLPIVN